MLSSTRLSFMFVTTTSYELGNIFLVSDLIAYRSTNSFFDITCFTVLKNTMVSSLCCSYVFLAFRILVFM